METQDPPVEAWDEPDEAEETEAEETDVEDERDAGDQPGAEGFQHCLNRSVMLPARKVLFVPMPKAGCTSVLWAMAELAGVKPQRFQRSRTFQVTAAMNVHDIDLWPDRCRWSLLEEDARREVMAADDWLRFTTVREPARRLFSAWQSKLLMREPQYVKRYGEAEWFPRIPSRPAQVVDDFRAFVRSLAEPDDRFPVDVHWARQTDVLADQPNLNFVGRAEQMPEVFARLRARVGRRMDDLPVRRENRTLLRFTPALLDQETADIVNDYYAPDFEEFGYPPLEDLGTGRLSTWAGDVRPLLPAVAELADRHERIGQLVMVARYGDRARQRLWEADEELGRLRAELAALRGEQLPADEPEAVEGPSLS